jgi:hypothetical protein
MAGGENEKISVMTRRSLFGLFLSAAAVPVAVKALPKSAPVKALPKTAPVKIGDTIIVKKPVRFVTAYGEPFQFHPHAFVQILPPLGTHARK